MRRSISNRMMRRKSYIGAEHVSRQHLSALSQHTIQNFRRFHLHLVGQCDAKLNSTSLNLFIFAPYTSHISTTSLEPITHPSPYQHLQAHLP